MKWSRRTYEMFIERGINMEFNKARLAVLEAHICRLSGGPDVSAANRAAVKKVKAALEEDPENEELAGMLDHLKLVRVCDGCGASARDEGVRVRGLRAGRRGSAPMTSTVFRHLCETERSRDSL